VMPHYGAVFTSDEITGDDAARYDLIHFTPRRSPLVGAIERLAHGDTEPLAMFHLADLGLPPTWTVGVPALLIVGLAVSAWRLLRW
jgi:hypothetical protein